MTGSGCVAAFRTVSLLPTRAGASADVKPEAQYVVYPGKERFAITKEIEAVSLMDLAAKIEAETR